MKYTATHPEEGFAYLLSYLLMCEFGTHPDSKLFQLILKYKASKNFRPALKAKFAQLSASPLIKKYWYGKKHLAALYDRYSDLLETKIAIGWVPLPEPNYDFLLKKEPLPFPACLYIDYDDPDRRLKEYLGIEEDDTL